MAPKSSKPLSAGDVIITAKPLIHIIYHNFKGKHCDNCLKRSDQLKRCSKCHQMFYCDRNCQTIDWFYHKNECKALSAYDFIHFSDLMRLLLRLYLCIKADETFATKRHQLVDGSDVSLNEIESVIKVKVNSDVLSVEQLLKFEVFCVNLEINNIVFNREELLHWFSLLVDHSLKIINPCLPSYVLPNSLIPSVGCGLYIEFLTLNHSLGSNCAFVDNGLSVELRAMKSIKAGEELTICAIIFTEEFLKRFCNECQCLNCSRRLVTEEDLSLIRRYEKLDSYCSSSPQLPMVIKEYIEILPKLWPICHFMLGHYSPHKSVVYFKLLDKLFAINYSDKQIVNQLMDEFNANVKVTHRSNHEIKQIIDFQFNEYMKRNNN